MLEYKIKRYRGGRVVLKSALTLLLSFVGLLPVIAQPAPVHFATGFRVGEVTQNSAIVWTRLTAEPEPNWDGIVPSPKDSPTRVIVEEPDIPVSAWEGAVPGTPGDLRLLFSKDANLADATTLDWTPVVAEGDFIDQFHLSGLEPATRYYLRAEGRPSEEGPVTQTPVGSFNTPAQPDEWQNLWFTVITGQMYYHRDRKDGFEIYPSMFNAQPEPPTFIVPTGDTVYYDRDNPRGTTVDLCRLHWHRIYSLPLIKDFHQVVPGYWEKDDHDTFFDDCYRGLEAPWIEPLTYDQGVQVFLEQNPVPEKPYRTIRWGKGLQIWLPEVRDFRSPNNAPDGPEKTIWGKEQKEWLMSSILESDASFKVLVSPTAIVGPDNEDQEDNHSNPAFFHEGNEFRMWTMEQGLSNLYICCGDRHWQYMSTHPQSGLREFSCGPASDVHAFRGPGFEPKFHSFYRSGGGFLSVSVTSGERKVLARPQRIVFEETVPTINFRFHDVQGKVLYEYRDSALVH